MKNDREKLIEIVELLEEKLVRARKNLLNGEVYKLGNGNELDSEIACAVLTDAAGEIASIIKEY